MPEVHIWSVALNAPSEALYATLSSEERQRSARFRFEPDRQRFIVAHGALRHLLGRYLGTQPSRVRFVHNAYGKPALGPEFGSSLRFNLSHSADMGLIAFAADADVGVDIERVRAEFDYGDIAQHRSPEAFFTWWTEKEACAKAGGEGLGMPSPDRPWSVYRVQPAPGYVGALAVERREWRLRQWQWRC